MYCERIMCMICLVCGSLFVYSMNEIKYFVLNEKGKGEI